MNILPDTGWFSLLIKASAQSAVLVVIILAVQSLLGRRLEPRWRSALWVLVVLRLALPWTIPSPVSVFNLLRRPHPTTPVLSQTVEAATSPAIKTSEASPTLPIDSSFNASLLLPLLWAAGAFAFSVRMGVNHGRFHRQVVRSQALIDESALRLLEDCKTRMGVRASVALVETCAVDGPCLFGCLRPRLLLPSGFVSRFSKEELGFVFLHELAHIKRNDIALGWFAAILQTIHWFNPFAWLAFARMRADREMACDDLVLSCAGGDNVKPYGGAIIKLLETFGDSLRAPGVVGILEDKNQLKQRLIMIAQFDKSRGRFGFAAPVFVALALLTLTDAKVASTARADTTPSPAAYEQEQTKLFQGGNQWAAFALWDSYQNGKNGMTADAAQADKWLHAFVHDVWIVKFEPVGDFTPATPGEFLAKINQAHTRSGKNDLGTGSFFRTTKQSDKLIGSFLVSHPDDFKAAVAKLPEIHILSVKQITPEDFVKYQASAQESLAAAPSPAAGQGFSSRQ